MPFITEEIWQALKNRQEHESITISTFPAYQTETIDSSLLQNFELTKRVVENIRRLRAEKNIPQKNLLSLFILQKKPQTCNEMEEVIVKLGNLDTIQYVNDKIDNSLSFIENNIEYFIPFGEYLDKDEEIKKLEEELKYTQGFLQSVLKKLGNKKFVAGAPEAVVAMERKKQQDAENKIFLLTSKIAELKR